MASYDELHKLSVKKVNGSISTIEPNTLYFVRTGSGFELRLSDATANKTHTIDGIDKTIRCDKNQYFSDTEKSWLQSNLGLKFNQPQGLVRLNDDGKIDGDELPYATPTVSGVFRVSDGPYDTRNYRVVKCSDLSERLGTAADKDLGDAYENIPYFGLFGLNDFGILGKRYLRLTEKNLDDDSIDTRVVSGLLYKAENTPDIVNTTIHHLIQNLGTLNNHYKYGIQDVIRYDTGRRWYRVLKGYWHGNDRQANNKSEWIEYVTSRNFSDFAENQLVDGTSKTIDVGRGKVFLESNINDTFTDSESITGNGVTLRAEVSPTPGQEGTVPPIFAVRSADSVARLWVGQSETTTGENDFKTKGLTSNFIKAGTSSSVPELQFKKIELPLPQPSDFNGGRYTSIIPLGLPSSSILSVNLSIYTSDGTDTKIIPPNTIDIGENKNYYEYIIENDSIKVTLFSNLNECDSSWGRFSKTVDDFILNMNTYKILITYEAVL